MPVVSDFTVPFSGRRWAGNRASGGAGFGTVNGNDGDFTASDLSATDLYF